MNRLVYTVFVFFWSSIATLLIVHWLFAPPVRVPVELPTFTLDEVAEHDSLDDCWMAIRGKVYDLTEYVPEHPTSPRVLERWCGREATEGMETKGIGRPHSRYAWEMLEEYLIGRLETDRR